MTSWFEPPIRCSSIAANKRLRDALIETTRSLYDFGAIDAQTMREFDALRLPPLKVYRPADIKRLRLKARASQAVFAAYLNTSVSTA